MNEDVLKGSSMTVALETGNTTDGTVILTADSTGKVMSGTYEVRSGDDTTSTPLAIKSSGLSLAAGQNIWDIYGNKLLAPAIPAGQSLSDNENIKIDAKAPDVTITGVKYDVTAGTITISGTNFNSSEINLNLKADGVTKDTNVLEQLDWSKLKWNIDGDDVTANDVTFVKDDFSAAVLNESAGEIVATLTRVNQTLIRRRRFLRLQLVMVLRMLLVMRQRMHRIRLRFLLGLSVITV